MTADEAWDGEAAGRLMLSDPAKAKAMRDGFLAVAGHGFDVPPDDIRVGSIPETAHLDVRRYSLGLPRITAHAKPARAGELVVVGAQSGTGKTAWAETMALANADSHRVLFVSLEMTREEVRDRMLAKLMRTTVEGVHYERSHDTPGYCTAFSRLKALDLMLCHPEKKKERTIQAVTQLALDVTAAVVIIDHTRELTDWYAGERAENVMIYLGDFVRRTQVTAVLLSQLKRNQNGPRRPFKDDFQDTARVEQKADRCILLWRPFIGQRGKDRVCEVIVAKNRQGPEFRSHVHWDGPTLAYHDMSEEEESMQDCCRKRGGKGHE